MVPSIRILGNRAILDVAWGHSTPSLSYPDAIAIQSLAMLRSSWLHPTGILVLSSSIFKLLVNHGTILLPPCGVLGNPQQPWTYPEAILDKTGAILMQFLPDSYQTSTAPSDPYTRNFKSSWPQTGRRSHTNYMAVVPGGSKKHKNRGW